MLGGRVRRLVGREQAETCRAGAGDADQLAAAARLESGFNVTASRDQITCRLCEIVHVCSDIGDDILSPSEERRRLGIG